MALCINLQAMESRKEQIQKLEAELKVEWDILFSAEMQLEYLESKQGILMNFYEAQQKKFLFPLVSSWKDKEQQREYQQTYRKKVLQLRPLWGANNISFYYLRSSLKPGGLMSDLKFAMQEVGKRENVLKGRLEKEEKGEPIITIRGIEQPLGVQDSLWSAIYWMDKLLKNIPENAPDYLKENAKIYRTLFDEYFKKQDWNEIWKNIGLRDILRLRYYAIDQSLRDRIEKVKAQADWLNPDGKKKINTFITRIERGHWISRGRILSAEDVVNQLEGLLTHLQKK